MRTFEMLAVEMVARRHEFTALLTTHGFGSICLDLKLWNTDDNILDETMVHASRRCRLYFSRRDDVGGLLENHSIDAGNWSDVDDQLRVYLRDREADRMADGWTP